MTYIDSACLLLCPIAALKVFIYMYALALRVYMRGQSEQQLITLGYYDVSQS